MGKRVLAALAVAAAAAAAASWLPLAPFVFSPSSDTSPAPSPVNQVESAGTEGRFAALPARAPLGNPQGELFSTPVPAPAPPRLPVAAAPQPAAAPPQPTAPPMPYRVAGTVVHDGVAKVVLAKGDSVLPVEQGDTVDGAYRVDAISADEITLLYVPLGMRERLPIASLFGRDPASATASSAPAVPAPGSRPAQLRWEGPARVQAGTDFTVTLRVTSAEPLRGSPLQLSFDAKLLEAVGVRPGRFFGADSFFSYRVSPDGLIVVGASGSGPGSSAADAELVVLTFKPVRAAASTEVRISSLALQGPVGKPIAVEALGAYRTSISP